MGTHGSSVRCMEAGCLCDSNFVYLNACVLNLILGTSLHSHNEHGLVLIADVLRASLGARQLVLVVHQCTAALIWQTHQDPFVPDTGRGLSALPTESVAKQ